MRTTKARAPAHEQARAQPGDEAEPDGRQTFAQDLPPTVARVGANREPDADLARASGDDEREDAVEADERHDHGHHAQHVAIPATMRKKMRFLTGE